MEPTTLNIKRLRLMVSDPAPQGAGEPPLFSDDDLSLMFEEHANIFSLAAEIWMIKAGLVQGEIQSYSTGDEKYDLTSMKDRYTHALEMEKLYRAKAEEELKNVDGYNGSIILKFNTPDVI